MGRPQTIEEDLESFTGQLAAKLPYGRPVPDDLLRRMIAFRVREHQDNGVLWM